eukprot:1681010-Pyramimonas_sp.AAC.1
MILIFYLLWVRSSGRFFGARGELRGGLFGRFGRSGAPLAAPWGPRGGLLGRSAVVALPPPPPPPPPHLPP